MAYAASPPPGSAASPGQHGWPDALQGQPPFGTGGAPNGAAYPQQQPPPGSAAQQQQQQPGGMTPAQQGAFNSLTPAQRQQFRQLPPAQQQALLHNRTQEVAFHARLEESLRRDAASTGRPVLSLPPTISLPGRPPTAVNLHRLFISAMHNGGTRDPQLPLSLVTPAGAPAHPKADLAWSSLITQAVALPASGNRTDLHEPATIRQIKDVWERYLATFEAAVVNNRRQLVAQQQQQQQQPQHQQAGAAEQASPTNPFSAPPQVSMAPPHQSRASSVASPAGHRPSPTPPPNVAGPSQQQLQYSQQQHALLQQQLALQQHQQNPSMPAQTLQQQLPQRQPSLPPGTPAASHASPVGASTPAAMAAAARKRSKKSVSVPPVAAPSPAPPVMPPPPSAQIQDGKGGAKRKRSKKDDEPSPSPALSHASIPSSDPPPRPIPPLAKGITGTFTSLLDDPIPSSSASLAENAAAQAPVDEAAAAKAREEEEEAKRKATERKRRKVEYCPLTKVVDFGGGWGEVRQAAQAIREVKDSRTRTVDDLGMVDIFTVTMSLRSRIATDVTYALNALTLLAGQLRPSAREPGIVLPLERCEDLLDELVDLLEETVFDVDSDEGDEEALQKDPPRAVPVPTAAGREGQERWAAASLKQLAVEALAVETELKPTETRRAGTRPMRKPLARTSDEDLRVDLGQVELVLSILNILRGFSCSDDSIAFLGSEPHLIATLISTCAMAGTRARRMRADFAAALGPVELLRIRRDVVQIMSNLHHTIDLSEQPASVCQALLELVEFYCDDARDVPRHPVLPLDPTPAGQQRAFALGQAARRGAMDQQHDAALSVVAKVAVLDRNRAALGRCDPAVFERLIGSLVQMLPLALEEFGDLRDEEGLTRVESEAMAIFNLVFISPRQTKLRLFRSPELVGGMVRLIRVLINYQPNYAENPYSVLVERCIAVLHLCAEAARLEQQPASATAGGAGAGAGGAKQWFGGGFAHEEPAGGQGVEPAAPSPLAARRDVVMSILGFKGISSQVFNQISALLDG